MSPVWREVRQPALDEAAPLAGLAGVGHGTALMDFTSQRRERAGVPALCARGERGTQRTYIFPSKQRHSLKIQISYIIIN